MVNEIEQFLLEHDRGRYSREEFDTYVRKEKLRVKAPVIHVAGSNGKGSTSRFLEAIYLAAGYRVGAFIKPAFLCVNECIRYNGKMIDDVTLNALFQSEKKAFLKYDLSAFEATVALAYRYFEKQEIDILIIETGMGGETDATNLESLPTILSIITSISLEHTAYLGTTLSQIALNKAGIIKPDAPVLLGKASDEIRDIIREEAEAQDSPFHEVEDYHFEAIKPDGYHFDYRPFKDLRINTVSRTQIKNAALAIEATKLLANEFKVSEEALRQGLGCALLAGRFERIGNLIFDGAHNPEATAELVASLNRVRMGRPVHVLFASMRDKNIAVMLPELNRDYEHIVLTTFDHRRARKQEDYLLYLDDFAFADDAKAALDQMMADYPEDIILITGSLAFVGYLREFYKK